MNITIYPSKLKGLVPAVTSKSHMQRLLICAALADAPTDIICNDISDDIHAAVDCLNALGAYITKTRRGFRVIPIGQLPDKATLQCGESGAVLRFLLPVAGALGVDTTFVLRGRLAHRPLTPLLRQMSDHGCCLQWLDNDRLRCTGKLRGGEYILPGNVSSQFISGLRMAFPLIREACSLTVTGEVASKPYIQMTQDVLALFGIGDISHKQYRTPGTVCAQGDWSGAAFYLGANALGSDVTVTGLTQDSHQADSVIGAILSHTDHHLTIDATDFPDLVPILAVIAAGNQGGVFSGISRLRLKESDRVEAICAMLAALGISAEADENTLQVFPGSFQGGTVDSFGDHRIAMAAAIAATAADGPVTILGAHCVSKSYPRFWEDYQSLGGHYAFDLR